jgi:hypothetical protein
MGLGCSVFAQAVDNLKGVDIAYNNFNRDLWLGGKKVFYNRELTKTIGVDEDGKPSYIAPDDMLQQLFVSVGDEFTEDKKQVHEFNPALRVGDNRTQCRPSLIICHSSAAGYAALSVSKHYARGAGYGHPVHRGAAGAETDAANTA